MFGREAGERRSMTSSRVRGLGLRQIIHGKSVGREDHRKYEQTLQVSLSLHNSEASERYKRRATCVAAKPARLGFALECFVYFAKK